MRLNIRMILIALAVVATTGLSFGQRTTATFAGIVVDPTSAVLPGAEIEIINEGTAALTQQVTSETGEFVFNFVPAGTYTLKITLPGFRTYESRGIPLGAAQNVKGVMPAEYGSAMAVTVSLITKSGTNEFDGSLFHRYEGSVL